MKVGFDIADSHPSQTRSNIPSFLPDLAEIPTLLRSSAYWGVDRRAPSASFFRSDFLGDPSRSLDSEVRRIAQEKTGRPCEGPIRLLTHVRYFGFVFNPVNFYYCFDRSEKFWKL